MKQDMIEQLTKNFNKDVDWIYLAGPFFNAIQKRWAMKLVKILTTRGYLCHAPVDEIWMEKDSLKNAQLIFDRNIGWMNHSALILAQLDYPLENNKELGIATMMANSTEFKGLAYTFEPVPLPDAGTIWEIGYGFAKKIPVIGYHSKRTIALNLMLAQGLTGYIENPENPLTIFEEQGIRWNLLTDWKGNRI